jgi:hypothetical protein
MLKSANVAGAQPAVYPDEAGKVLVSDGIYEITAALNVDEQIVALCILPARCVPLDFTVVIDDIDNGGTAHVFNAGGINAAGDDLDYIMISGSTAGQAGGVARAALFPDFTPQDTEKLFGIMTKTAAGTPAAGTIRAILSYRSEEYGG